MAFAGNSRLRRHREVVMIVFLMFEDEEVSAALKGKCLVGCTPGLELVRGRTSAMLEHV